MPTRRPQVHDVDGGRVDVPAVDRDRALHARARHDVVHPEFRVRRKVDLPHPDGR